jgi:hypothetical protein
MGVQHTMQSMILLGVRCGRALVANKDFVNLNASIVRICLLQSVWIERCLTNVLSNLWKR